MCRIITLALAWCVGGLLTQAVVAQQDDPFGLEVQSEAVPQATAAEISEANPSQEAALTDPFGLSPQPTTADKAVPAVSLMPSAESAEEAFHSVPINGSSNAQEERIRAALKRPATVDFQDAPLSEVVDYLKEAAQIPILIDKQALDNVGLGSDTPVTVSLQDISLRSVLRLMLKELELTYIVHDEVLRITTPEQAEREPETRLYPVSDLAQWGTAPVIATGPVSRFQLICDLIQAHIQPDSWHQLGGPGTIIANDAGGFLAVSQSEDVHRAIDALLATVRRARVIQTGSPNDVRSLLVADVEQVTSFNRIEEALRCDAQLEFNDAPLSEVVSFVKSTYGIPIYIDRKALESVGLGTDTPTTISLKGVSLRAALHIMLSEINLTFCLRDEVLKITTPEEVESVLMYRVLLVSDFAGSNATPDDLAALAALIQSTLAPDTWEAVGGAGSIGAVESWGLLLVAQIDEVHEQISGLLSAARSIRSDRPAPHGGMPGPPHPIGSMPPGAGTVMGSPSMMPHPFIPMGSIPPSAGSGMGPSPLMPGQAMLLKPYVILDGFSTDELKQLIMGAIPGDWRLGAGCQVFPVGNTLVIRQTPAGHAQIKELLRALRAIGPAIANSGFSPGFGGF